MYDPRLILISLLIKLGIAAAVSSALARSRVFKRLLFVDQDAGAFVDDALHRQFELLTAVAAERAEDIAGEALRMNADDRGRDVDIAEHEGDGSPGRQGSGSVMTPSKPWMRKCPQREGKSASAILLTVTEGMHRL